MNKNEMVHLERKEYWRNLIQQCDASGQAQQDWCKEHSVCAASLSRWRNQIWREEEAEKEIAAAREERCFVEILPETAEDSGKESKSVSTNKKASGVRNTSQAKQIRYSQEEPHLIKPDAIIGCREFVIGVYEHTSVQLLQKVVEVLKYA